jgi:hypothetical protein
VSWKLDVHIKAPLLVLTDLAKNETYEFQHSDDLLEKLGR